MVSTDIDKIYLGSSPVSAVYQGTELIWPTGATPQSIDEIWYTTSDGNVVELYQDNTYFLDADGNSLNILSHTYENGKGVIKFDGELVEISGYAKYNWGPFHESLTLQTVTLPSGVLRLNNGVFRACYHLTSVTITSNLERIGNLVFYMCIELAELNIPDTVNYFGASAFGSCRSITGLTIPSGVTYIGNACFQSTKALNVIYAYPSTIPTCGELLWTGIKEGGILHYPSGSDYSSWFVGGSTKDLEYYGWTGIDDL